MCTKVTGQMLFCSQRFLNALCFTCLLLMVPDEGYTRKTFYLLNLISIIFYEIIFCCYFFVLVKSHFKSIFDVLGKASFVLSFISKFFFYEISFFPCYFVGQMLFKKTIFDVLLLLSYPSWS